MGRGHRRFVLFSSAFCHRRVRFHDYTLVTILITTDIRSFSPETIIFSTLIVGEAERRHVVDR